MRALRRFSGALIEYVYLACIVEHSSRRHTEKCNCVRLLEPANAVNGGEVSTGSASQKYSFLRGTRRSGNGEWVHAKLGLRQIIRESSSRDNNGEPGPVGRKDREWRFGPRLCALYASQVDRTIEYALRLRNWIRCGYLTEEYTNADHSAGS